MKKIYALHFLVTVLALTLLRLWLDNKLMLYVHPSTIWFVGLGGVAILIASLLWAYKRSSHFHISNKQLLGVAIVILVVALAKNVPLSPSLAKQRQNGSLVPQMSRTTIAAKGATTNFNVLEWWMAWESDPTHRKYAGSSAKVTGFIMKDNDQYSVARILLTCCAVDAQPIQVGISPLAGMPKEDSWVEVEGVMEDKDGKPFIKSVKIVPIDAPENQYVY